MFNGEIVGVDFPRQRWSVRGLLADPCRVCQGLPRSAHATTKKKDAPTLGPPKSHAPLHPPTTPHSSLPAAMDSQSKKRKRHKGDVSHKSAKKPAVSFAKDEVHVSLVDGAKDYPPVLAVPVGLSAPSIPLRAYTQAKKSAAPSRQDREIVLHSSEHPRLDYFATEEFGNSSEKLLKHYIAIYDPESAQMKLVQVRRVALRSTLRQTQAELDEAANPEYKSVSRIVCSCNCCPHVFSLTPCTEL